MKIKVHNLFARFWISLIGIEIDGPQITKIYQRDLLGGGGHYILLVTERAAMGQDGVGQCWGFP